MSSANMSNKKVIKPLNPENVICDNIKYSNVKVNTEIGSKWIDISYCDNDKTDKMFVVIHNCIVKTVNKVSNKDKNGIEYVNKDGSPRKDKYQIFMGVDDSKFIKMINDFEASVVSTAIANSENWFNEQFNEDECRAMLKSTLSIHEKYGTAIGGICGRNFICKSKSDDVTDVSDITVALQKGTVIDVCMDFTKLKLGTGTFGIGFEIAQINIIKIGSAYIPFYVTPDIYTRGLITLTKQQQHDKGGKFCNLSYDEKPLRLHIENCSARIFKFDKDGPISYSISVRLSDLNLRKMIENIEQEIFDLLLTNSKEYFGAKKTAKLLKAVVKSLLSFSKPDQEKIKKGEPPSFDPSLWIKIYWNSEKGFDGKVINSDTGKPITKPDDIINTNLTISSLDVYSRHIWFGPKGTTINFTLNKCAVNSESTEYDMDNIDDTNNDDTTNNTTSADNNASDD